jgi:MFS family permease
MDKSHSVRLYIAVLSYFSVAFMAVSGLPAYLMAIVQRDNHRASRDDVAKMVASLMAIFSFANGCSALLVAGWAGKLSDHFGRRRCAAVPAMGQAIGMGLLALAAHLELSWQWSLAAWVTTGLFGGPFVFLAAAFAYIADFTLVGGRGKAFSRLDSIILYVACVGPVLGGPLVDRLGFVGLWGISACMYAVSAIFFATAPPSPQVVPPPASAAEWARSFTPVLLVRMLLDAQCRMGPLALAFLLATGGVQAGVQAFILYAQRYLDWREEKIGLYVAPFSALGATLILIAHPLATYLLKRPPTDLSMVRAAYFGPVLYFTLLAAFPAHAEPIAFGAMPLLASGACALPHFRALFSAARPQAQQGEQMALVAALESLPALYATPLIAVAFSAFIHTPNRVFLLCNGAVGLAILMLFCIRQRAVIGAADGASQSLREALSMHETASHAPAGTRAPVVARVSSEWLPARGDSGEHTPGPLPYTGPVSGSPVTVRGVPVGTPIDN